MKKTSTLFLLAAFALVYSVQSVATPIISPYAPTDTLPICSAAVPLAYSKTDLAGALSFDYITYYYNSDGDSAPLMVTNPTGGDGFKFSYYLDNSFTTLNSRICAGTASGATFVHL